MRALLVGLALALAVATDAGAVVRRASPLVPPSTRTVREIDHGRRTTAAWQAFASTGTWSVMWDRATGVPHRIWGSGLLAPGASASPAIAERFARAVLERHLALLAPGAAAGDFVLVANHVDGAIRSVGFAQRARGRRVVGGQLSFRFARDRLNVIASEALPHVVVAEPTRRAARFDALRRFVPRGAIVSAGEDVVLPLVARDGVIGYRVVAPFVVDGEYLAYLDPESGDPIAIESRYLYATGTLRYRGVDRHPGRGFVDLPAPRARVLVGGQPVTTALDGRLSWPTETPQPLITSVSGDLVRVENLAPGGVPATAMLSIAPGGTALWDASALPEDHAQVVTFLATNAAKEYVRANIDPAFPGLDVPIRARVNHDSTCNAYYDGQTINFFQASLDCQNTGLLEDVVYHEYAHALHDGEIIEGVGFLDVALAEGVADFFAASITGDPGTARGFYYTDEALRHLDPEGEERTWPDDITEVHQTGLIVGGALWDLRKALIASLGDAAGIARTNRILLGIMRRASSIPSVLVEALAADDDDGDLSNGTPNECAIRDAFGRHGLRTARGTIDAPGALPASAATSTPVRLVVDGLSQCSGDTVSQALLIWRPDRTNVPPAGTRVMTASGSTFAAELPLPTDGPVFYAVKLLFADGTAMTFADNLADPSYTLYRGDTVPLYCTDFETVDPFTDGWTSSDASWAWGTPTGGVPTDPGAAFSGTRVLAQGLDANYGERQTSWVALPPIDIGQWSDVRLQYRRWLAVQDQHLDQVRISSSGEQAWITGAREGTLDLHHIDREWRFHDVPVSGYQRGHILDIRFELTSDGDFELGGWALDDVCVVANVHSVCGDGVRSPTEQCDDGEANGDAPDACRSYCQPPRCGDGIVDTNEECDDGGETSYCSATCESYVAPPVEGCCSSSALPTSAWLVGVVMLWLSRRRAATRARSRPSRASSGR